MQINATIQDKGGTKRGVYLVCIVVNKEASIASTQKVTPPLLNRGVYLLLIIIMPGIDNFPGAIIIAISINTGSSFVNSISSVCDYNCVILLINDTSTCSIAKI